MITENQIKKTLIVVGNFVKENNHTDARDLLSACFNYDSFHKRFSLICEIEEIEGCLPEGLGIYRKELTDSLLTLIQHDYGIEIRNRVNACL